MTQSEFALVVAGDDDYARGLAVALHSALVNLSAVRPELYLLDNGLSESSRVRLLKVVDSANRDIDLRWIQIPADRLGHLTSGHHLTPAAYARLLIPDVLPQHVRRAVYIDADVLVRKDLSPLFKIGLGDAPVGAVRDFVIGSTIHESSGVRERAHARPYFNTGVLVMDLSRWRRAGLTDSALQYATAGCEPLPWGDQDALNAVAEDWHELDYEWNLQHTRLFQVDFPPHAEPTGRLSAQRRDLYRSAAVLHFTGQKPWYGSCTTRGRWAWVHSMIRTGWDTRGESLMWLIRYLGQWGRYWAGTHKHALQAKYTRSRRTP